MQDLSDRESTKGTNPLVDTQYNSYLKLLLICLNGTLGSFFVGYSLVVIGAFLEFKKLIEIYDLRLGSLQTTQSIVNGLVPVGAMLGALSSSQLLLRFSRRNGFLVVNGFAACSLGLMLIHNQYCLLGGRLLQGVCTGVYSTIVPLYINEMITPDSSNLGTLNQVLISFSQFFCFLWYLVLTYITENNTLRWLLLSEILLVTVAVQSIVFIFVFPHNTPKYLYQQGLEKECLQVLAIIYKEEYVDEAMSRFSNSSNTIHTLTQGDENITDKDTMIGACHKLTNSKVAIFFAIFIALLQQMGGVNAIMVYGKLTLTQVFQDHEANILQILVALLPVLMSLITIKFMKLKGRKFIVQLGTVISSVCLAAMVVAFSMPESSQKVSQVLIICGMVAFMASFGLTLGAIVWLYIPEMVESNILPFSTMTNLTGAAFCIIVFPYFQHQQVIIFSVFLGWNVVSLFINQKLMVETKDKPRQKVFREYSQMTIF